MRRDAPLAANGLHGQKDTCQHCGQLLTVRAINEGQTPTASRFTVSRPSWLEVRPDDGVAMRTARRTAFAAHLPYAGIMWVFMMVFAALVH